MRLFDRSRVVSDWTCPRKRFYNYEAYGRGIVPASTAMPLFLGSVTHDGLATIAGQHQLEGSVDIDLIASTAQTQVFDTLMEQAGGDDDKATYAREQATLLEGLLRGFHKHVWPRLVQAYPTILAIEQEMTYTLQSGNQTFMSKPDLVVADPEGNAFYIEYKTTSSKQDSWMNSWSTAVQLHSTIRAIKESLDVDITAVIVQGLYKGYQSYGKQSSPFCLSPNTKVLTSDLQWLPLGEIKNGNHLAAFDEFPRPCKGKHYRLWRDAEVTKIGRTKLPSFKLTFSDGTSVVCSKDHFWLTTEKRLGMGAPANAWLKASELRPRSKWGLRASRLFKVMPTWNTETTFDGGYLRGALEGEGHIAQITHGRDMPRAVLGFSQKPGAMMNRIKALLQARTKSMIYGPYDPHGTRSATCISVGNKIDILTLLGSIRPERLLKKLDLDKFGIIQSRETIILEAIEDVGEQEVIPIETSTGTLFAEGIATHNCYAYRRNGNPPFTQSETRYDFAAGFKRYPAWELEGGVKAWVEGMPESVLTDQFPTSPPIFIKDELIDAFFAQRAVRESEIDLAMQLLQAHPDSEAELLNTAFPQRFDQCTPGWGQGGHGCDYRNICHGHVPDPLEQGFTLREPHHTPELDAWNAEAPNDAT